MQSNISILQNHIHHLCPSTGRTVGSRGHQEAQQYLIEQIRTLGLQPYKGEDYRLPYIHNGISFCNLAGVIPGKDPTLPPLLIGAHYDSCIEAPSADDNAAATTDVPQWLDYNKMTRIADYIDALVNICMDKGQEFFKPKPFDPYSGTEFVEFEAANMRKAFENSLIGLLIEDQTNSEQFLRSFYRKFPFGY
jgi:hypothetical protein